MSCHPVGTTGLEPSCAHVLCAQVPHGSPVSSWSYPRASVRHTDATASRRGHRDSSKWLMSAYQLQRRQTRGEVPRSIETRKKIPECVTTRGTRQRRRRLFRLWVAKTKKEHCRWRSPDHRNWLSFTIEYQPERSTPPARVQACWLEPLPASPESAIGPTTARTPPSRHGGTVRTVT